jgi:hypothetical protein
MHMYIHAIYYSNIFTELDKGTNKCNPPDVVRIGFSRIPFKMSDIVEHNNFFIFKVTPISRCSIDSSCPE